MEGLTIELTYRVVISYDGSAEEAVYLDESLRYLDEGLVSGGAQPGRFTRVARTQVRHAVGCGIPNVAVRVWAVVRLFRWRTAERPFLQCKE